MHPVQTPEASTVDASSKRTHNRGLPSSSVAMAILLLLFLLFFVPAIASITDTYALLTFKSSISDPMNFLSTWNNSSVDHPCNWKGISCTQGSPPSIVSVDLHSFNLSGEFSPSICQVSTLAHLNLADNFFNQPIPLLMSQCETLKTLNLSSNLLWGTLPEQLSLFTNLEELDVSKNHLEGQIPISLGSLVRLKLLSLARNSFTGGVHSSIFSNLTSLEVLDLSENLFLSSEVPLHLKALKKLKHLFLQKSNFYGDFPDFIGDLPELEVIDVSENNLTGVLPLGLGSDSKLASLEVSVNRLHGSIPSGLCDGNSLTNLGLHTNFFDGSIPISLEQCSSLERIQIQNNAFTGDFPSGLWSLPKIKLIRAENNRLQGGIPASVSFGANLEQIQIDNNSFTGRIPKSLGTVSSLYRISASYNKFFGDFPENFCSSPLMSIINLSYNSLSGMVPQLLNCKRLVSLYLAGNSFTGRIPSSLGLLPVLTYIDLSSNNLTGEIPPQIQNLKLALFNVSFNHLSGEVPLSLISGLPASFLQGNPDLCGPGLPRSCESATGNPSSWPVRLILVFIFVSFFALLTIVAVISIIVYRFRNSSKSQMWKSLFLDHLGLVEHDILLGIVEKNIVGTGCFGEVYKVRLPGGEFVAVKKLRNHGALSANNLKAGVETLYKIRHKNIARLLGCCYSRESILLVYEYLQNGSLIDAICRSDLVINWNFRLQIAVEAAEALAYLHSDCVPHLLHRNIKSRNILLDMDFKPKIVDFELDLIVGESAFNSSMDSALDSQSYKAPECGCSKKATEQMDVYSFGVVLLELITGRQADKVESGERIDVVKWVRRKINTSNGHFQILDARIRDSSKQQMLVALEIALRCTAVMPEKRPTMLDIVKDLHLLLSDHKATNVLCLQNSSP